MTSGSNLEITGTPEKRDRAFCEKCGYNIKESHGDFVLKPQFPASTTAISK